MSTSLRIKPILYAQFPTGLPHDMLDLILSYVITIPGIIGSFKDACICRWAITEISHAEEAPCVICNMPIEPGLHYNMCRPSPWQKSHPCCTICGIQLCGLAFAGRYPVGPRHYMYFCACGLTPCETFGSLTIM